MDQKLIYGLIGGIVKALLFWFFSVYSVNNQYYAMMRMMGMGRGTQKMMLADECEMDEEKSMMEEADEMSMREMLERISTLKGDEFDKEFIRLMIEHHRGAIDMAEMVSAKTERPELREMARDIISAQSKEVEIMKGWSKKSGLESRDPAVFYLY